MACATAIDARTSAASSWRAPGAARGVLEAAAARAQDPAATIAIVLGSEGSTYVRPGAIALFVSGVTHVGWLSGGCLETELAQQAKRAAQQARLIFLDVDTRDDSDLLSGSAIGCRGCLRIALLPLRALPGFESLLSAWRNLPLAIDLDSAGIIRMRSGACERQWQLELAGLPPAAERWSVAIASPPSVLCFGAGPESGTLLPLLRQLGWVVSVAERRSRWLPLAQPCDRLIERVPHEVWPPLHGQRIDATVVMHHNFELDRDALEALADYPVRFIGLLGPVRRRDDLFAVLPGRVRDLLLPRLHSPIGLPVGGRGPEAIALSIAAQLQAWTNPP